MSTLIGDVTDKTVDPSASSVVQSKDWVREWFGRRSGTATPKGEPHGFLSPSQEQPVAGPEETLPESSDQDTVRPPLLTDDKRTELIRLRRSQGGAYGRALAEAEAIVASTGARS